MSDSDDEVPAAVALPMPGDFQASDPDMSNQVAGGPTVPVTLITGQALIRTPLAQLVRDARAARGSVDLSMYCRLPWSWQDNARELHSDSKARLQDCSHFE